MPRETRTVAAQVRSGFKIAGIMIVVLASVLFLLTFLPIYRLEAWVWHLRHGNNIQAGGMIVPVPSEWLVRAFDGGMTHEIELTNTKGGQPFWGMITITVEQPPRNINLDDFANFQRRVMENFGLQVMGPRQLNVDGVSGLCLDGQATIMTGNLRNIACRVGTNLVLEYRGSPLEASSFYSILDGIAKGTR
jgi:hypothetical protein